MSQREVTSRISEDLVLGSVLFKIIIMGMVKAVSSCTYWCYCSSEQKRAEGTMKEACTDLNYRPTEWQGCLEVAYRKQEGSCAWNRVEGCKHLKITQVAGDLWVFSAEMA